MVAESVEFAKNPFARFLGLMGRPSLGDRHALVLEPCNAIHTFVMRFPIDAVFLDSSWQVVAVRPSMRPWRSTWLVRRAKRVAELPSGTILRHQIEVGDHLDLDTADGGAVTLRKRSKSGSGLGDS